MVVGPINGLPLTPASATLAVASNRSQLSLPVAKGGALAFGMRGKIFRSDDAGISWQEVNTDNEASLFGGWVMDDQSLLLVGQNGTALLSRDHGRSFVRVPAKGNRLLSAVLPAFPGGDFFVFGEGGFARIGAPAGAGK